MLWLSEATGMDMKECSAWVKDRVPWREWFPKPGLCPHCGENLRTAKAKQCFACGADWHGSENE